MNNCAKYNILCCMEIKPPKQLQYHKVGRLNAVYNCVMSEFRSFATNG